jgi:hypothetical protein
MSEGATSVKLWSIRRIEMVQTVMMGASNRVLPTADGLAREFPEISAFSELSADDLVAIDGGFSTLTFLAGVGIVAGLLSMATPVGAIAVTGYFLGWAVAGGTIGLSFAM